MSEVESEMIQALCVWMENPAAEGGAVKVGPRRGNSATATEVTAEEWSTTLVAIREVGDATQVRSRIPRTFGAIEVVLSRRANNESCVLVKIAGRSWQLHADVWAAFVLAMKDEEQSDVEALEEYHVA